jgi:hypothetical protein
MRLRNILLLVILVCLSSVCVDIGCAFGGYESFVKDKSFQDEQLKVNQQSTINLLKYWHFELHDCHGKKRTQDGLITSTIQDTSIAQFLCMDKSIYCSDSLSTDTAFTLKAIKAGTTTVNIKLDWIDEAPVTEHFAFKVVVTK